MPSVKSSAVASGNLALCVLNLTPAVGDLMVVWIGLRSPQTIHPPTNYGPGIADSWVPVYGGQSNHDARLWCFYKTANATDATQSSFTFTFLPMTDTSQAGLPQYVTTDFVAAMVTYQSSGAGFAGLDISAEQSYPTDPGLNYYNLPQVQTTGGGVNTFASAVFSVVNGSSLPTLTHSDPAATVTRAVTYAGADNFALSLSVYLGASGTSYPFQITSSKRGAGVVTSTHGLRDNNSTWYYRAPFVREGYPYEGQDQALILRYQWHQQYTVLNNGGALTAGRFFSQDQLAAATQVFTQTSLVQATDRTNILNAGVGGDFMIGSRNGC